MNKSCIKFRLLLWKNYLLLRRNWRASLYELVMPIVIAGILLLIKNSSGTVKMDKNSVYSPFDIQTLPSNLTVPKGENKWVLAYDHENITSVQRVMNIVAETLNVTTEGFKSAKAFIDAEVMLKSKNSKYLGLVTFDPISFDTMTSFSKNITYKIRLSPTARNHKDTTAGAQAAVLEEWHTNDQYPSLQIPGPRSDGTWGGPPGYMSEGFLPIQHAVSAALITILSGETDLPKIQMQRFPYPPYTRNTFVSGVMKTLFPLFIVLAYLFSTISIAKAVVYEKEKRLKESMKVMGLSNWLHWSARFVLYFIVLLISTIIVVILMSQVLQNSDPYLLFIFFLVYIIHVIAFSFLISVFFSSAYSAATAASLLSLLTWVPYIIFQRGVGKQSLKIPLSILGNTAMAIGADTIIKWEGTGSGIQFSNIASPVSPDDSTTLLQSIIMLLFDSFLYGTIAWYVEAVFPGEFGMAQPFYFPFMPSYWCGGSERIMVTTGDAEVTGQHKEFIESNPVGLEAGISLRNLCKVYKPALTAVDDLSLDMFKSQVTALLGHNGAGKTTTMSMLTGIYPPTSGTALVDGLDIRYDISKIREGLGFCPQHDILFDELTVEEHIYFYCTLKGWTGKDVTAEITRMVKILNLSDKRDVPSKDLSGGMKRKLSVGIALCARSKIVMLDEPTSGMDPAARRLIWDLLEGEKKNRTILLTTHYMEEADVLGDRIAILAGGKLQCCGSPMFLKKKYGAGYHMVLVKDSSCDVDVVSGIVTKHVPDAEFESNTGAELSYTLPHQSSSKFENLFQEIEDSKDKIGITGYGASLTTMEEVFIKVGKHFESEELLSKDSHPSYQSFDDLNTEVSITPDTTFKKDECNTGATLAFQQFRALLVKRIAYTLRNKLRTFYQFLYPILMLIVTLVIIFLAPKSEPSPPLTLSLKHFKGTKVAATDLNSNNSIVTKLSGFYKKQFSGTENKFVYVNAKSDSDFNSYLGNIGKENIAQYSQHWIIGAVFTMNSSIKATAFFNNQPYHSAPISLSAVQNAMMNYYVDANHRISVINDPLPKTSDVKALQKTKRNMNGYQLSQSLMMGISILSATFIFFIVKERSIRFKHLEIVSGVNLVTFWISTFAWDFINYIVPCIICVVMFPIFNTPGFTEPQVLGTLLLLMIVHGFSILPVIYVISFLFSVPSNAYSRMILLLILMGIGTLLPVSILEMSPNNHVAEQLDWGFSIFPTYCLGRGVYEINKNYGSNELCDGVFDSVFKKYPAMKNREMFCEMAVATKNLSIPCCPQTCSQSGSYCIKYFENYSAWDSPGIGRLLVFLVIDAVVAVCFLILIEKHAFRWLKYNVFKKQSISSDKHHQKVIKDDDVEKEYRRINNTSLQNLISTDMLIFKDLTKNYGDMLAVDHLSLGISRGECFGLLGMNGAGKTSTFKMITGDEIVTEGDAYLDGYSVKEDISKVQKRLGYCPQFDALIDEMTGEETIRMFARLRGVPESVIGDVIQKLSTDLLLNKHIKKLTREYSGGNKRKLSTAIALVGEPPIVFLDEPTSGIDPVARRQMWKTICEVKESGRSVLLTSHSMEECEALCGRLVIMVNGSFRCLGSPQHLKSKFGNGYTVLVKIIAENDELLQKSNYFENGPSSSMNMRSVNHASKSSFRWVDEFQRFFTETFPGAKLISAHQAFVHYHVPINPSFGWAKIFGTMENAKSEYHIEDYTVSQTTLEQVFLQFAKMQRTDSD